MNFQLCHFCPNTIFEYEKKFIAHTLTEFVSSKGTYLKERCSVHCTKRLSCRQNLNKVEF